MKLTAFVALTSTCVSVSAQAAILSVGPGKQFQTPCQAIRMAHPGDVIEIDATTYTGDVCFWNTNNLTLRGVGGRPVLVAGGASIQGKGIWAIGAVNTTVENIEFRGARGLAKNAAGIWHEGKNITIRHCVFRDNQNGVMGSNISQDTVIEHSEFAHNGNKDGYSHNVYIGISRSLVFRYNYSHHARQGQLLKSRAATNHILYNRLTNEDGIGSYEIDLPYGGRSYVIGNVIHQGPATNQQGAIIAYRLEGAHPSAPSSQLYVVNNTVVNERAAGATFVRIAPGVTTPAVIKNNIFFGPGVVTTQADAILANNLTGAADPMFVNRAAYDYRLQAISPAIDRGVNPGADGGVTLSPAFEYVHPVSGSARTAVGMPDIGAYEYSAAPPHPSPIMPPSWPGTPTGWKKGFNFRGSAAFTADGPNETYVLADTAPQTRNGVTFGWSARLISANANRNLDRRLAGFAYTINAWQRTFQLTLPAPGTYEITLALGAATAVSRPHCEIRDGGTRVLQIDDRDAARNGHWTDSAGGDFTAGTWITQNRSVRVRFNTTSFQLVIGGGDFPANITALSHLQIEKVD
jgi:hypothetical protein